MEKENSCSTEVRRMHEQSDVLTLFYYSNHSNSSSNFESLTCFEIRRSYTVIFKNKIKITCDGQTSDIGKKYYFLQNLICCELFAIIALVTHKNCDTIRSV